MRMVRYTPDPNKPADFSPEDRAYLESLTDEQKLANALGDPDAQPATDAQLERAVSARSMAAIRVRTGLTQAEFAAAIGAPFGTVRNWEQGRSIPGPVERRVYQALARNPAGTPGAGIRDLSRLLRTAPNGTQA